jgi:hypothetical protein
MQEFKEDTGTLSIWHRNRTAHFGTYDLMPDSPNGPRVKAETIARPEPDDIPQGVKPVRFKRDDRVGFYWIVPTEEDGQKAWLLQGCMAVDGSAADVTIWFEDPQDRNWAIKTFESVSYSKDGDSED